MGVKKFVHRTVGPVEFNRLRRTANLSVREFMFLTGRHSALVEQYQGGEGREQQRPTMGDVLVMEILARHPGFREEVFDIAREYLEGSR